MNSRSPTTIVPCSPVFDLKMQILHFGLFKLGPGSFISSNYVCASISSSSSSSSTSSQQGAVSPRCHLTA